MIRSIKRITYGKSTLPQNCILPNGDPKKKIPILFSVFLIQTDDRCVLVDAGCDTMPGFEMVDFIGPVAALERAGYRAEEITDVILTHAHHDHIDGIRHFGHARIYLHRDELAYAQRHGVFINGETPELFEDHAELEHDLRIVHTGGHTIGSSVVEAKWQGQNYVICGDECYSMENIRGQIPSPSTASAENSKKFIERYATGNFICLLAHDE
jgi:glyoxylase-like metal-dependent hydrolase (beta-lactamase superfamily II)